MPKRARADEAGGESDAITRTTKAAINRHGWEGLRLAYHTGRLRFLEGVGSKTAAEIALLLHAETIERSHWQHFLDLVQPHLNSDLGQSPGYMERQRRCGRSHTEAGANDLRIPSVRKQCSAPCVP